MNPTHANLNSRECSQHAIDTQIKSLEDSIRALRLQRNALAAVSSLPPEIFSAIFSFVCLPGKPDLELDYNLSPLRISHVCHRWREISLNQPHLWSHIDFTTLSLAGATEMLARAKSAPLYLEARVSGQPLDKARVSVFQGLEAHVPRICHLLISADDFRLRETLKGLVSPAPILESLSLTSQTLSTTPIPETLFDGATPRLSCLRLCNCGISWKSPLFKGLRSLKIRSPSANTRPSLSVWLGALNEMRRLETLALHSASPIEPHVLFDTFDTERPQAVTLPSLTHLEISSPLRDCAFALTHLDLPALTWLCLEAAIHYPRLDNLQKLLPHVVRLAHGPQDSQPLQSALILNNGTYIDFLAWTVPDIDVAAYDPLTLQATTLPTRVALSLTGRDWLYDTRMETMGTVIAALPLDNLVTLIVKDNDREFWPRNSLKWPLLRRVRLMSDDVYQFSKCLLADNGGRENLLLPALKELVLVDSNLSKGTLCLCDALMKRIEQGVPLETLDLRTCRPHRDYPAAVRLLSEIVVDVLGPEETIYARAQIESMWDNLTCGPFVGHDKYR